MGKYDFCNEAKGEEKISLSYVPKIFDNIQFLFYFKIPPSNETFDVQVMCLVVDLNFRYSAHEINFGQIPVLRK
jgi:hypothetical protein